MLLQRNAKKIKRELQRAILRRDAGKASQLWTLMQTDFPNFIFPEGMQYDLCVLLMVNQKNKEAISAYESLIDQYPDASLSITARLELAYLYSEAPERRERSLELLKDFLRSSPPPSRQQEAEQLIAQIQGLAKSQTESSENLQDSHPSQSFENAQVKESISNPGPEKPTRKENSSPFYSSPFFSSPKIKDFPNASVFPPEALPSHSDDDLKPFDQPVKHQTFQSSPPKPALASSANFQTPQGSRSSSPDKIQFPDTITPNPIDPLPGSEKPPPNLHQLPEPFTSFSPNILRPRLKKETTPSLLSPSTNHFHPPESKSLRSSGHLSGFQSLGMSSPSHPPISQNPFPLAPGPSEDALSQESGMLEYHSPLISFTQENSPVSQQSDAFEIGARFLEKEQMRKDQERRKEKQLYEATLEKSRFSAILPFGKQIYIEEMSSALSAFLGVSQKTASMRLRAGKGMILSDLSYDEMFSFHRTLNNCPQEVLFVRESDDLNFGKPYEVLSAHSQEIYARVTTECAQFRVLWDQVQLISVGKIQQTAPDKEGHYFCADVFVKRPKRRLQIHDWRFHFRSWEIESKLSLIQQFQTLITTWAENCPEAIQSHTLEWMRKKGAENMQVFITEEEYNRYTRWLLLNHYGDQVNPAYRRPKTIVPHYSS